MNRNGATPSPKDGLQGALTPRNPRYPELPRVPFDLTDLSTGL